MSLAIGQAIKHFTISCCFKILDAEIYGGVGSTGYSCMNFGFENQMKGKPQDIVDDCKEKLSTMLEVSLENVISISYGEYEENTEED